MKSRTNSTRKSKKHTNSKHSTSKSKTKYEYASEYDNKLNDSKTSRSVKKAQCKETKRNK